jgi:hypothetical protein
MADTRFWGIRFLMGGSGVEFGIWKLEFGNWNLGIGIWNLVV